MSKGAIQRTFDTSRAVMLADAPASHLLQIISPSEIIMHRSTWMAQLVEQLPLDLGSGHDLTVGGFKPCIRLCAESVEPARDSLSPSLSAPPPLACSLSLK